MRDNVAVRHSIYPYSGEMFSIGLDAEHFVVSDGAQHNIVAGKLRVESDGSINVRFDVSTTSDDELFTWLADQIRCTYVVTTQVAAAKRRDRLGDDALLRAARVCVETWRGDSDLDELAVHDVAIRTLRTALEGAR